jgi:hypothetical protein
MCIEPTRTPHSHYPRKAERGAKSKVAAFIASQLALRARTSFLVLHNRFGHRLSIANQFEPYRFRLSMLMY